MNPLTNPLLVDGCGCCGTNITSPDLLACRWWRSAGTLPRAVTLGAAGGDFDGLEVGASTAQ